MKKPKSKSVEAVKKALADAGSEAKVKKLRKTAGSTKGAAKALKAPLGAMVKSAIYMIGKQAVMVLIAGDKRCASEALPRAFNLEGKVSAADADQVRAASGFPMSGLSPVGLTAPLPTVIDVSLKRFDTVYVAAGQSLYVFPTTMAELKSLTAGLVSYNITKGDAHNPVKA
ncbi:MAG: YbaK/EbsC family protein [Rhodospirillales bacterium]|jgi:prolyl-tRNA editing enzyme YbaK/EbsC (Cys-tRNA(Pro) deacylase)|nr:YbaK/EbsC family protein [Rhodospirillales bacterium]